MKKKILSRRAAIRLARRLRDQRKKIVFTNGTFDLLHLGHVTYLEKARRMGDVLIVGVNSDASVKTYKGPDRPINPARDRLRVLSALESVDYVVLFGEPAPRDLVCEIRPHILVKGSDWRKNQIAGAREVESWGGVVRRIPLVKNRSTTRLIQKIK